MGFRVSTPPPPSLLHPDAEFRAPLHAHAPALPSTPPPTRSGNCGLLVLECVVEGIRAGIQTGFYSAKPGMTCGPVLKHLRLLWKRRWQSGKRSRFWRPSLSDKPHSTFRRATAETLASLARYANMKDLCVLRAVCRRTSFVTFVEIQRDGMADVARV